MMDTQKKQASEWFETLRNQICADFEKIEQEYAAQKGGTPGVFERKSWNREGGGGGTMSIMRGLVFEKVGVNISTVWGELTDEFREKIPGASEDGLFWASGISLVAHMVSPKVPAVHMNTRHIITSGKSWFGGGTDLTPMVPCQEDTEHFHKVLQEACDTHDSQYYPKYKKWCDEYFFLPHRNEPRGVGGIFYDYFNTGSWDKDFDFTQSIGKAFLQAYSPLVRQHMFEAWTKEDRAHQLLRRGRYAEFNLLYDRGTQFGLKTGGNTEAILMSLPPEVKWA